MIEKKSSFTLDQEKVDVYIRYRVGQKRPSIVFKQLDINHEELFAVWDYGAQCVNANADAESWYIELAVLCETLMHTDKYQKLYAEYLDQYEYRETAIERFVLSVAGEHASEYIADRLYIYDKTLLSGFGRDKVEAYQEVVKMFRKARIDVITA